MASALAAPAASLAQSASGPKLTVHVPEQEDYQLALDEIELDWSQAPDAARLDYGSTALTVPGAVVRDMHSTRVVFAVTGVRDQRRLLAIAAALEQRNTPAEAQLVLYEYGRQRALATRRLLNREVAVLAPGVDPLKALAGLAYSGIRAAAIPGAWIVRAPDPLTAVALANSLRRRPGVTAAYPLLRQHLERR